MIHHSRRRPHNSNIITRMTMTKNNFFQRATFNDMFFKKQSSLEGSCLKSRCVRFVGHSLGKEGATSLVGFSSKGHEAPTGYVGFFGGATSLIGNEGQGGLGGFHRFVEHEAVRGGNIFVFQPSDPMHHSGRAPFLFQVPGQGCHVHGGFPFRKFFHAFVRGLEVRTRSQISEFFGEHDGVVMPPDQEPSFP